ncbi:hypothetical protein Ciccas_014380 [Cichlidogyrus casuarinus]|uniref:Uncharacterized protein n=1 Tax=Cichlidogyrus casuarinus TaxID=1844966 RepID=A0ABD2PJL3_9PLAT
MIQQNGYLYGLGFCVILYIPILVFALLLVSLYRKTDEYNCGDPLETNYVNYQGFYMSEVPNTGDSKYVKLYRTLFLAH